MRILFLSPWFPFPPDNGSKIRIYHLPRALGQRHEVRLLSFAEDGTQYDSTFAARMCRTGGVVPRMEFQLHCLCQARATRADAETVGAI